MTVGMMSSINGAMDKAASTIQSKKGLSTAESGDQKPSESSIGGAETVAKGDNDGTNQIDIVTLSNTSRDYPAEPSGTLDFSKAIEDETSGDDENATEVQGSVQTLPVPSDKIASMENESDPALNEKATTLDTYA